MSQNLAYAEDIDDKTFENIINQNCENVEICASNILLGEGVVYS